MSVRMRVYACMCVHVHNADAALPPCPWSFPARVAGIVKDANFWVSFPWKKSPGRFGLWMLYALESCVFAVFVGVLYAWPWPRPACQWRGLIRKHYGNMKTDARRLAFHAWILRRAWKAKPLWWYSCVGCPAWQAHGADCVARGMITRQCTMVIVWPVVFVWTAESGPSSWKDSFAP